MGQYMDMLMGDAAPQAQAAPPGAALPYMDMLMGAGPLNQPTGELSAATPEQAARMGKNRMSGLLENTVDSPDASASVGATLAASLPAESAVNKRIAIYAKSRGIDPARYGVDREGNIFFLNDNNKAVREVPSMSGSAGPVDFLRRLGANIGARLAPGAVSLGSAAAGIATGPTGGSVPVAAATAGLLDYVKQAAGNVVAGDDMKTAATDVSIPSILGEAAMGGAGQMVPYVLNKATVRNPLRVDGYDDIRALRDPARMAEYVKTDQNASQRGITLTPGEITDARSLRARERQLGRFDETATQMGDFYRTRATEQVPAAVGNALDQFSTVPAAEGARNLQSGAGEVARKIRRDANQASGPFYDLAMENQAMLSGPAKQLNERLRRFIDDPIARRGLNEGLEIQRLESVAKNEPFDPSVYGVTRGKGGKFELTEAPNMRTLHAIKKGLDNVIESYRNETGNIALDQRGRAVEMFRQSFVHELDKANPDYQVARKIYASKIEPIDEVKGGLVGQAARSRAGGFQNVPELMFGKNASDPISAMRNRKLFEDAGRMDDWNAGLRSFLEDRFANAEAKARAANPGANFYDSVFANERQRNTLKAAMSPEQWNAFDGLMKALEPLRRQAFEGSPTATDIGAKEAFEGAGSRTVGAAVKLASPNTWMGWGDRVHSWTQNTSAAKQAQTVADIITKPGAIDELKYLRVLGPRQNASAAIVGQIIARYGGREAAEALGLGPQERVPPILGEP